MKKSMRRLYLWVTVALGVMIIAMNGIALNSKKGEAQRPYRVEINRICQELEEVPVSRISLEDYTYVTKVIQLETELGEEEFYQGGNEDYVIRVVQGTYYRLDYTTSFEHVQNISILIMNISYALIILLVIGIFYYIRKNILEPFHTLRNVPFELSKGNLTVGLRENKNRFFGRFVWGLNLLRENLEEQKEKELALQKEKKTLVLSLSHDIKTPLSAIKLYSKAISRNLYQEEEKRRQIADNISQKADEIESFVAQIIKATSEDFLKLEVKNSEFYLEQLMKSIDQCYREKLALLKITWTVNSYRNCLMRGDVDRAVEVLQNILENAIKYGDGENISISVNMEEDCQLVTVKNSGCSLSDNELPHIFDSFWRGSNVGNKNGSGLGLYICRQLLRKMGGDIYAQIKEDSMEITAVFQKCS